MDTVTVDGKVIAYRQSAGEQRTVVLVHGNSASSRTWQALLDGPFGRRFHCLALDLPGHGDSPRLSDKSGYSVPGYAATVAGFAAALDVRDAVLVGWSLGGHIVLEAAPLLGEVASGLMIFGTPPISSGADLESAFLPHPATANGFTGNLSAMQARDYAAAFLPPGSSLPLAPFVTDILRTDGAARTGLATSLAEGRAADEVAIAATLRQPLAVLHGRADQLVSLAHIQSLSMPTLWRGTVQLLDNTGHAPHEERPEEFRGLLEEFIAELPSR